MGDQVRLRFLAGGKTAASEYQRTEQLAREFKASGYTGEPPRPIASHMRRYNETAEEAVTTILTMAETMNEVLDTVRDHRLDGKTAIEALGEETDEQGFQEEYKQWHQKLDAIKPTT